MNVSNVEEKQKSKQSVGYFYSWAALELYLQMRSRLGIQMYHWLIDCMYVCSKQEKVRCSNNHMYVCMYVCMYVPIEKMLSLNPWKCLGVE